jgi:hypothetical protein
MCRRISDECGSPPPFLYENDSISRDGKRILDLIVTFILDLINCYISILSLYHLVSNVMDLGAKISLHSHSASCMLEA